jgi:hypothetical protein
MRIFSLIITLTTLFQNVFSSRLSIVKDKFMIDNKLINLNSASEGILINSRMIQGISDGFDKFPYKDTKIWNATRNNYEFVKNMSLWKSKGLNAFTIGLQGGGPNSQTQTHKNSAFNSDGSLKLDYMNRLKNILIESNRLDMIVIVSLFYKSQVKIFSGYPIVLTSTLNVIRWIQANNFTNVIIEPVNECEFSEFKSVSLGCDQHIVDLITLIQLYKIPAGNSYKGSGHIPSDKIINASQVIFLHGNSMKTNNEYKKQVDSVRKSKSYKGQPIVYNEASTDYTKLVWCVKNGVGFGYYDQSGFQLPPINWSINTTTKQKFFNEVYNLTHV